jgi:hypothetical protein
MIRSSFIVQFFCNIVLRFPNNTMSIQRRFKRELSMYELFSANPWLIMMGMIMLVPISGIVFGTLTSYLQRTRLAELDTSLKHAMLERGMSAEEIKMVLEASASSPLRKRDVRRMAAAWHDRPSPTANPS